jgi:hypothetical protein
LRVLAASMAWMRVSEELKEVVPGYLNLPQDAVE